MENEDAFAAEAQEEVALTSTRSRNAEVEHSFSQNSGPNPTSTEVDLPSDEEVPLLSPKTARVTETSSSRAAEIQNRAISQPWMATPGSEGLPWYKKPSVSWPFSGRNPPLKC